MSDVNDAGNLLDLAADEPVLRGFYFVQAVAVTDETIAINLADGRPGRKLRREIRRQSNELQAVQDFLAVPVIVAVVVEIELYVAQAENRDGANILKARNSEENGFDGDGDLTLHFFGGPGGILRDHFDERRRRIGIGFDVQAEEKDKTGDQSRRAALRS